MSFRMSEGGGAPHAPGRKLRNFGRPVSGDDTTAWLVLRGKVFFFFFLSFFPRWQSDSV